jgi:cell division protein FtsQ
MKGERLRYTGFLMLLIVCAMLLTARLIYMYAADAHNFPLNTVKITASYQHITHKQLEKVLASYLNDSFFSLPTRRLEKELSQLEWANSVHVERVWPDTLKIVLEEKSPVAVWNNSLMTEDGRLFNVGHNEIDATLPRLNGPAEQHADVLQNYQKLSKLLAIYGLHATALRLRDNQAWELYLSNGIQLRLGKQDLEKRLLRFCRAYPAVFADKPEQLASVDLRYARGMAVQWKELIVYRHPQQTGKSWQKN